jgi:YebC/PmpR family DNA-binding regulatory protein
MNLSLRYAIDKAKDANMPKDTIEKAIKKGTGELGGARYEEVVYEGYGVGGVAIMLEALTDNRNRTAGELRHIFERRGGSLGATGCVGWMFAKKGQFVVDGAGTSEEQVMEVALEAGADDVQGDGGSWEVTCASEAFEAVKSALEGAGLTVKEAELAQVPGNYVAVADEAAAKRILALMESLEEHEDVQNVYANFDIPEDVLAKIENE